MKTLLMSQKGARGLQAVNQMMKKNAYSTRSTNKFINYCREPFDSITPGRGEDRENIQAEEKTASGITRQDHNSVASVKNRFPL
jgi:hypothetical protein